MLTYIGSGSRDYYTTPVRTGQRGVWEFQAVIEGEIAPVFQYHDHLSFQSRTLWVFPPDSIHGWAGRKGAEAEILVFHFTDVTDELVHLCGDRASLAMKLDDSDIDLLKSLHKQLYGDYSQMGDLYSLKSRMGADKLALLVCTKNINLIKNDRSAHESHVVEKCEALFRAEMHLGISLIDISGRIGMSVAHLRRLFHNAKGSSPRLVLEEIRMNRARDLSCRSDYSFLEISQACGYSEQSAFTKAFCRYWDKTPSQMRAISILSNNPD